jgi:hypothetical protein
MDRHQVLANAVEATSVYVKTGAMHAKRITPRNALEP